jgi:lipopolysaccharide export system permease protein
MLVAALLTSLSLYLNGQVIPKGNRKLLDFENKYLLEPYFNEEIHIHRQVAEGVYIYMQAFNAVDTIGYAFALEEFDGMELRFKVQSQTIQWDYRDQKWVLNNYMMRKIEGLKEDIVTGKRTKIELPIKPEDFGRKDKNIHTMNNRELAEYVRIEDLRGDSMVVHYKVEKHRRFAMPFATFVLVLIAFSVSSKKTRGGIGIHLFLGIMIAFSYLLFMQFSKVFSIKGQIDPMIAVWIPNILYAFLGFYLLKKAPK